MKIIVDVDGVLADLMTLVVAWVNARYGTHFKRSDIREWNQPLEGTGTDIGTVIAELMLDDTFLLKIPSVEGSIGGMKCLNCRYHVMLATARPHSATSLTMKWLWKRDIHWKNYVTCVHHPKSQERGDVLIDDNVDNCLQFAGTGRVAILFDQPWNRDFIGASGSRIVRARGWEDVLGILKGMEVRA